MIKKLIRLIAFPVVALSLQQNAQAQTGAAADAPALSHLQQEFSDLYFCQSEFYGIAGIRSHGWNVVDSLIQVLGKEKATSFFQSHLQDTNKSVEFYSLVGIYRTAGTDQFHEALMKVSQEPIMFQNGCVMQLKPLPTAAEKVLENKL